MSKDQLLHKLVLHARYSANLLREIVADNNSDPTVVSREMAAVLEADELIKAAKEHQPTLEQLKEWEKDKPWLSN